MYHDAFKGSFVLLLALFDPNPFLKHKTIHLKPCPEMLTGDICLLFRLKRLNTIARFEGQGMVDCYGRIR